MAYLDTFKFFCPNQGRFWKNHLCETQLSEFVAGLYFNYHNSSQTDIILIDFAKAFHTVPPQQLFYVWRRQGRSWRMGIRWIELVPSKMAVLDCKWISVIKCNKLLFKFSNLQIDSSIVIWTKSFVRLKGQCATMNNTVSSQQPVISGVPQGSMLCCLSFMLIACQHQYLEQFSCMLVTALFTEKLMMHLTTLPFRRICIKSVSGAQYGKWTSAVNVGY